VRRATARPGVPALARAVDRALWGPSSGAGFGAAVALGPALVFAYVAFWNTSDQWIGKFGWAPWSEPTEWWAVPLHNAVVFLLQAFLSPGFAVCALLAWRFRALVRSADWQAQIAALPGAAEALFDRFLRGFVACVASLVLLGSIGLSAWSTFENWGSVAGFPLPIFWMRSSIAMPWLIDGHAWTAPFAIVAEPIAWFGFFASSLLDMSIAMACLLLPKQLRTGVALWLGFQAIDYFLGGTVWYPMGWAIDLLPEPHAAVVQSLTLSPLRAATHAVAFLAIVGAGKRLYDKHVAALPERYAVDP